jgi:5-methylcytosine-specific restriction endonuclease McrBC GTP-binding regulatory subunit McrB
MENKSDNSRYTNRVKWSDSDRALALLIQQIHVKAKGETFGDQIAELVTQSRLAIRTVDSWKMKITNYKDADMVFYGTLPAGRKTFFPTSTLSKDKNGKFTGEFVELTELYSKNSNALKLIAGSESRRTTNPKLLSLYESLGITPQLEEQRAVIQPQAETRNNLPTPASRLINAASSKPFTILAGGTGTGKTRSAKLAAVSIAGTANVEVVAVGADWTDNRPLLGFRNLLAEGGKTYVAPHALRITLRALENPGKPYFLVLDEMNLSHVERYFADFLSSMESKEPLKLHDSSVALKTEDGITVPGKIAYPNNLFVIGTVNIDETTYMFSPKVLDRAHVIEFKVTWDEIANGLEGAVPSELPALRPEQVEEFMRVSHLTEKALPEEDHELLTEVLEDLHAALEGTRFVFAHRTARECLNFIASAKALAKADIVEPRNTIELIDLAILQKALPKLNGASGTLSKVLEELIKVSDKHDLELCKEKLESMSRQLKADQFVSFIQ